MKTEESSLDDVISQLISKGLTSALGAAGSQGGRLLLGYFLTGTTDPAAAKFKLISDQLITLKEEIQNLPHDTAVYLDHFTAFGEAEDKIRELNDLLHYSSSRKTAWPTYQAYLGSLTDKQWEVFINFLLPGTEKNYFALCNKVVFATYGQSIDTIFESAEPRSIAFGESDRSFAKYININQLKNQPINIGDYIGAHNKLSQMVLTIITGVVKCVQTVLEVFRLVEADENIQILEKTRELIVDRLRNKEILSRFRTSEAEPLPAFFAELFLRIMDAPGYLCGNAFKIYNEILRKNKYFYIKNCAVSTYIALNDYDGDQVNMTEVVKYETVKSILKAKPYSWKIEFSSTDTNDILIEGKNISALCIYYKVTNNYDITSVPTSLITITTPDNFIKYRDTRFNSGKIDATWRLQLISRKDEKKGPGEFTFFITNPTLKRSLQCLEFLFFSKELGLAKPDSKKMGNQWQITLP